MRRRRISPHPQPSAISHQPSVIAGEACPVHLVFWQPIPSFHQEGFLTALAQADWVASVTLKYESALSEQRRQSGWRTGEFNGVRLQTIRTEEVPVNTSGYVHFFTGFDTHPGVWGAFHRLPRIAHARRFAFAEAPEALGIAGAARRLKYKRASVRIASRLDGILAIGQLGVDFYRSVLPPTVPVHQFGYYDVSLAALSRLDRPNTLVDRPSISEQHPTPYRFLCVGQLIRRKGVDRFLRALSELRDTVWQLDIVGAGAQQQALQRQARRLGIEEQICWHPAAPTDALAGYYWAADCLVLPSRWDGWGMTVNEALRCGCDVLVSQTCGAASAVSQSARLPKNARFWAPVLAAKVEGGALSSDARAVNQQTARSLSGEAGAERLKRILSAEQWDR